MSNPMPQPGWYPDPTDANRVRYWNGGQWSVETRARWASAPATPSLPQPSAAQQGPERQPRRELGTLEEAAEDAAREIAAGRRQAWLRVVAALFDAAVVTPLVLAVSIPAWLRAWDRIQVMQQQNLPPTQVFDAVGFWLIMLGSLVIWFGYGMLSTRLMSGTPGQRLLGLRVVSAVEDTPEHPSWAQAAKRGLLRAMAATLLLQPFSMLVSLAVWCLCLNSMSLVTRHREHRSFIDLGAGTRIAK